MRDAILVLGMHRSGTSAVTGAIAKMGATLPCGLMQADSGNEKGYFEPERISQFHDRILSLGGSSWYDWRAFNPEWIASPPPALVDEAVKLFAEAFGGALLMVFKEPRMCRLVPFWRCVFKVLGITPRVVIPFRSPFEVALSLQARHNLSVQRGILLWIRHVIEAERYSRDWPRCFVPMDDFLSNWRHWARRIAQDIGVVWPTLDNQASVEIDQFLSPDLKHYNVRSADQGVGEAWITPLYESLQLLAQSANSSLARVTLDGVSDAFETACNLMGPDFVSLEASNAQLRREIAIVVESSAATLVTQGPAPEPAGSRHQLREDSNYGILNRYSILCARTGDVRGALEEVRAALKCTQ